MELDAFWSVIDSIKDSADRASALQTRLAAIEPAEIVSFQEHFDRLFDQAYDWKLWGAAYLVNGGCSDDGFMDFRYGLISRGRAMYEAALADPDSLADTDLGPDEIEDEMFGYAASTVYEQKTGQDLPRSDALAVDPTGAEWDFDDVDEGNRHLPKIAAKFL